MVARDNAVHAGQSSCAHARVQTSQTRDPTTVAAEITWGVLHRLPCTPLLLYKAAHGKRPCLHPASKVMGDLPFKEATDSETVLKILEVDYSTPDHLSNELCDLISKMIVKEPADRISVEQVRRTFCHIWELEIYPTARRVR